MKEIGDKLLQKQGEVEKALSQEKALEAQAAAVCGENAKFSEVLSKVFRRRVKLKKEEADVSSDDELSTYLSDLSEEEEEEEEICPQGCPAAVWEKILSLRSQRTQCEDIVADLTRHAEVLRKEYESQAKKTKMAETQLKGAENETRVFQTSKQHRLNELLVVVSMSLKQILAHQNNSLPEDLGSTLVFSSEVFDNLVKRTMDLKVEKATLRRSSRERHKANQANLKINKAKQVKIAQLEERAVEVQVLKFGRVVDLEQVERLTGNKAADELKTALALKENDRAKEIRALDNDLSVANKGVEELVTKNTELLRALGDLTSSRNTLHRKLDTIQDTTAPQYHGNDTTPDDNSDLLSVISTQKSEIEALKNEMAVLSSKHGTVYPPS
eukprot:TRINITY_DN5300_c0_g1_i2.p1 TRINITY_DN5300_c0_g1~~TRINITY_DN5300_c0_g1_i2.p1  ORF type:complete len:448 (-),score=131.62 TRINITY_DN5300_c0_g1_i2:30-1184(-)